MSREPEMSGSGRTEERRVDYLRLSVTDRCNLRCVYCMPPEGVPFRPHEEILSYEEQRLFVEVAMETGISKVRITGGEPLVRRDLPELVHMLSGLEGLDDISLTTNGLLLPRLAPLLKDSGLKRVNISLDSVDPERYAYLTRGGSLEQAVRGVEAALENDLTPVKLNAVMMPETLDEVDDFVRLTRDRPLHVRFIEWMPVGGCGPRPVGGAVLRDQVLEKLAEFEDLRPEESPGGSGPARYYRLDGYAGTIGFISSVSDHFCGQCNRLRLTADGRLRSCLFSDEEIDVRSALAAGDREATAEAIRSSLSGKSFDRDKAGGQGNRTMSEIGG